MTADHWIARADRDSADPRLLGEDENGYLFVPSKTRPEWWDRRFCWWKPTHWPYWLRSRLTLRVAMIESSTEEPR